jgi:glycosyltransferase involved in cell wall biosynthesis
MRILWLCPFLPYPPNTGSKIREYNLISSLSQKHKITLFSLIQSPEELKHIGELRSYCSSVTAVLPNSQTPGVIDGRRRAQDALWGIVDKRPHRFYGSPSDNVKSQLKEVLEHDQFEAMLVDTLFMSNYLWDILLRNNMTTVLMQHNVETLIQKQQFEAARSVSKKLRKWLYYRSFVGFERRACRLYDYVVVVSELERNHLLAMAPEIGSERVVVVPNGVDAALCSLPVPRVEPNSLIYPGALTYDANLDAMAYFLKESWPIIQKQRPQARLHITGRTDDVDLSQLPLTDQVILTGYLDDVRSAIAQSWVCVVPLRLGGGTRLKILESLALGTPVVASSKGAEGLDAVPGRDLLIADTPAEFADHVLHLLNDPDLRQQLSENGRRLVLTRYNWATIGQDVDSFLECVVNGKSGSETLY